MKGKVVQINLSGGGVPKLPVPTATLFRDGFFGDIQKNKKYHGGPDRAVCLFSLQLIQQLQAEGHPITPGSTGENLTLHFPDYHLLVPGMILQIGATVRIQITDYAPPCKTIKRSFLNNAFTRIGQKQHPGSSRLYARVLQEGTVQQGDEVLVVE
jgi:MOSC domain-containing protein YiiM